MRHRLSAAALAFALLFVWPRAQATVGADGRTPSLVVVLMVDQFRADYIDRYSQQWSHGLRRLLDDGASFKQTYYPYSNTVTCAGHSTVSTGSMPSVHGMIMNGWWDAGSRKEVTCTEDASVTTISYGNPVKATGESLLHLRVPTLADELRAQLAPPSRSIAFSLKARSAAPLAGHHPEAVAWFDDSGAWVTSTAFSTGPVPEVTDYVRRHPVDGDFSKVWDRALPVSEYLFESPAIGLSGEIRGRMTLGFPHVLASAAQPDRDYYTRWQSSPYADEYLAQMTIDIARRMRLGSTPRSTDLIGVSFSTLDKVGHDYGPNSHEVQDVLIRLDRTLGDFLSQLDQFVGAGNYVVALTADHGVAPVPERARQFGIDAGRVDEMQIVRVAESAFTRAFGRGSYVSHLVDTQLYLQPGVYSRLQKQPEALQAVREALRSIDGIQAMYTRDEIENGAGDDPVAARLRRSHVPGRSGDLTLVTRPYWIVEESGTSHGSNYGYDTHVPLLLMGKGITPGEYLGAASPLDVAPTLAFLANVTLASSQGRVLSEAISALPATQSGATR